MGGRRSDPAPVCFWGRSAFGAGSLHDGGQSRHPWRISGGKGAMRRISRLGIALLISASLAATAQAQVAPEAKRAIRAAMATCIDWVRGKTDWRKTPPPGFATPTG